MFISRVTVIRRIDLLLQHNDHIVFLVRLLLKLHYLLHELLPLLLSDIMLPPECLNRVIQLEVGLAKL